MFSLALANSRRPEWLIVALGIGAVTTGTSFLFTGSSTYTFLQIDGTRVHATDIVIILNFLYLLCICLHPIRKSKLLAETLLLIVPFLISFTRGLVNHTYVYTSFFADIRKYGAFIIVLLSFYICFRDNHTMQTQYYIGVYVKRYMVLMFGMTLLIWMLDIGSGLKSLPGQIGGTLSDGSSTFRIITPSIVIVMAYYVLYKIYTDIQEYGYMKITLMLMAAVIVLLQWRTVVAAFGVGVILVFIDEIIDKHKICWHNLQ